MEDLNPGKMIVHTPGMEKSAGRFTAPASGAFPHIDSYQKDSPPVINSLE
jgi:hypothetical protein